MFSVGELTIYDLIWKSHHQLKKYTYFLSLQHLAWIFLDFRLLIFLKVQENLAIAKTIFYLLQSFSQTIRPFSIGSRNLCRFVIWKSCFYHSHFRGSFQTIFSTFIKCKKKKIKCLRLNIVTRKETVWKRRNLFCLCYVLPWIVPSRFARGQNLTESFNNINLNVKFWKKYNLRQPRLCFKKS